MSPRLKKFVHLLIQQNLDAFLVLSSADIFYLTGFPASGAWLLVTPKRAYYLTDSRYSDEARQGLGNRAVVRLCRHGLDSELTTLIHQHGIKRLGFDENHCPVARLKRLKNACPKTVKLVAFNGAAAGLRVIKDAAEIAQIRECLDLNLAAYRYLQRILKPGMTERQILWKLEDFVIRRNNAGFAFDPIIASGPNSALPHARVTDRCLKNTDIILIDLGIRINGYNSDLTRIFLSDKIARPFKEIYQAVAEAQEAAIARIQAGVPAAEVDLAARKSLKRNKLDKFFTHATGHGVGVEIHEAPRLSAKSPEVLTTGMVVTVEPGVYLRGKFGIRIEDMVLVTDKGCEILSRGQRCAGPGDMKF